MSTQKKRGLFSFLLEDESKEQSASKIEEQTMSQVTGFTQNTTPKEQGYVFPPNPIIQTPNIPHINNCDVEVNQVLTQYERGFEGLNQQGYDFFEFFKAVNNLGVDNVSNYKIIFETAKSFDPSLDTFKLKNSAQFYIQKLNEVHQQFKTQGESELAKIENTIQAETQHWTQEIVNLEKQLLILQKKLEEAAIQKQNINVQFTEQVEKVKCKIVANDIAHERFINSIQKVNNNINF